MFIMKAMSADLSNHVSCMIRHIKITSPIHIYTIEHFLCLHCTNVGLEIRCQETHSVSISWKALQCQSQ